MSEYRLGDEVVEIASARTRLRLSVSALAEMAQALEAKSPRDLATRLRSADASDWNKILRAVATPRPDDDLSKDELFKLMPVLSSVISKGLRP